MRAIHIDDVRMLARFAAQNDEAACFDALTQAHIADKYRKNFCVPTPILGWVRFPRPCVTCRHPWKG